MNHIAVFCREPIKSQVKTRLIGRYSADVVTQWYCEMVERTLRTASAVSEALGAQLSLWVAADSGHAAVREWADRFGATLHVQQGTDLGDRMHHALATLTTESSRALLIGTDCPVFTPSHLIQAFAALTMDVPWVFTPAEDGGYVLVGTRAASNAPFSSMPWSTPDVMRLTRERLKSANLRWREMPALWDVDEPSDVERAVEAGLLSDLRK
jgi:uncharacterized protein